MTDDGLRLLIEGRIEDLATEWQGLSTGLQTAVDFDMWNFRHVLAEQGWRLRRAGLDPHDPTAMATLEAEMARTLVGLQRQGRVPPLHLYAGPKATDALQVQTALPVFGGMAFIPAFWDGHYIVPTTVLERFHFENNRAQISALLSQMRLDAAELESARDVLLKALSVGEEGQEIFR
jgi:hypothetical protein